MSADNPYPGVVFHAEPDIIRAFANRLGPVLGGLSPQVDDAVTYRRTSASADSVNDGPIGTVQSKIRELGSAIDSNLVTIKSVLDSSSDELGKTAHCYETVDEEYAARMDATYPE